jgi:HK97 family phage major capsid protein
MELEMTKKEKMEQIISRQQIILDRADAENREMNSEEQREYDHLNNRWQAIKNGWHDGDAIGPMPYTQYEEARAALDEDSEETREAWDAYLKGGEKALNYEQRQLMEQRALSADLDSEGGFLVPTNFLNRLVRKRDDLTFIRSRSTVIPMNYGGSLDAPALDNDPADPEWTSEIKSGSDDSTMDFGKRSLHPHPLARRIKFSKKLPRVSPLSIENIINDRLAYKFAVVEENNYLNGDGVNKPLGMLVDSEFGIDSSRDITTAAASIKADDLIDVEALLKQQYRTGAAWIMGREAQKRIRRLKDGSGQYIWMNGLGQTPNTILGYPVYISEYMPSYTSGNFIAILADYSNYWIAESLRMTVQIVTELYAETNQNAAFGRAEIDGMPILAEAFARLKLQ